MSGEVTIADVFGSGGAIARASPHYRPRAQQIEMAEAVGRTLCSTVETEQAQAIIVEGPPGVGKSFAYLVPALLQHAETKRRGAERVPPIIVATAMISLQEQLVDRDVPFLFSALHSIIGDMTVAICKGRSNYLCLRRYQEALIDSSTPADARTSIRMLQRWAYSTETGDRSELEEECPAWGLICSDEDECSPKTCGDDCFSVRARRRIARADVIVTNYHLLLTHFRVQEQSDGFAGLLPRWSTLILDEAHQLADIARNYLGWRFSAEQVQTTVRRFGRQRARWGDSFSESADVIEAELRAGEAARSFGEALHMRTSNPRSSRLKSGLPFAQSMVEPLRDLADIADRAASSLEDEEASSKARRLCSRLSAMASQAEAVTTLAGYPSFVYWTERSDRDIVFVNLSVVDPAPYIGPLLFSPTFSTVVTSATLATTPNDFSFARRSIGFPPSGAQLQVSSPFDLTTQALYVLPPILAEPGDPNFLLAFTAVVEETIARAQGRTLVLCTSFATLDHLRQSLHSDYPLLFQGDAPRSRLIARFREEPETVLIGVASMWTGVDVPGESLSVVVVEKLPFPNVSDPVMETIRDIDPNSFMTAFLPTAVVTFRQGVGRLIRSVTDRGVVVVCDRRVTSKNYGSKFLQSIGSVAFGEMRDIDAFLRGEVQHASTGLADEMGSGGGAPVAFGASRFRR